MSEVWLLFARLILRPIRREPLRTALTMFAVALGVGVVVAIDLAGQAAAGSFHSSLESLAGKSDLQLSATGGLDQNLLGRLVQLPYAFTFSPRISDFASINGRGEAFPFIGLDLIGHPPKQNLTDSNLDREATRLDVGAPIWVGKQLGLPLGERVRLLINDRMHEFTVPGVLQHGKGEIGEDTAIVAAVISMAQSLKLRVVAEGVETLEELEFLRAHHCDEAQGYYFSPPVPPEQFVALLGIGIPERQPNFAIVV